MCYFSYTVIIVGFGDSRMLFWKESHCMSGNRYREREGGIYQHVLLDDGHQHLHQPPDLGKVTTKITIFTWSQFHTFLSIKREKYMNKSIMSDFQVAMYNKSLEFQFVQNADIFVMRSKVKLLELVLVTSRIYMTFIKKWQKKLVRAKLVMFHET